MYFGRTLSTRGRRHFGIFASPPSRLKEDRLSVFLPSDLLMKLAAAPVHLNSPEAPPHREHTPYLATTRRMTAASYSANGPLSIVPTDSRTPYPGFSMQGVEVKDCIRLHTRVWADCLNISLEVFRIFLDVAKVLYLIAVRNKKATGFRLNRLSNYLEVGES